MSLGSGIYTIPDISKILFIPNNKVRRWVKEYWDNIFSRNTSIDYSFGYGRDKTLNFYTLIEVLVFNRLREKGFNIKSIIEAHSIIASESNFSHPFAMVKMVASKKSIFYLDEIKDSYVKANKTNQRAFKEIIDKVCEKIDFDNDQIALRYWPLGKKQSIVVDPKFRFGQPIIEGTNISVDVLYNFYKAGETVDSIANLYNLDNKNIESVITFFNNNKAS